MSSSLSFSFAILNGCLENSDPLVVSKTQNLKTQTSYAPVIWNPRTPPIRALMGDCGDFHLIFTSFWFPGRRKIRLKSRSAHPLPGYLLATQRSICLFHGCQQCFLIGVLRLAIISCFTKGVPSAEKYGQGNAPLTFVPLTFTCIKSDLLSLA